VLDGVFVSAFFDVPFSFFTEPLFPHIGANDNGAGFDATLIITGLQSLIDGAEWD